MRTRTKGIVLSRTVDEHGTTTRIEGGDAAYSIRYRPHEDLSQMFQRIVEHVQHVAPLAGPVPADVWRHEEYTIFGMRMRVSYGVGAGLKVAALEKDSDIEICASHVPADKATLTAAGEAYGEALNRAIDIARERRNAS